MAVAWGLGRGNEPEGRLTTRVVAGTTADLGQLLSTWPYFLGFLFITHKSFAFY